MTRVLAAEMPDSGFRQPRACVSLHARALQLCGRRVARYL